MTIGRTAHITTEGGQWKRYMPVPKTCVCVVVRLGAYFSSNSATLPAAEATGNMTLRPYSIVTELILDETGKKSKRCKNSGFRNEGS
jgi:choline dehydrogenase-like flavoprotein